MSGLLYAEPNAAFSRLRADTAVESTGLRFTDETGLELQISYLKECGWSLEVRYDLCKQDFRRQILTGAQDRIETVPIEISEIEDGFFLQAENSSLKINADSSFELRSGNKLVMRSTLPSFSWHQDERTLYENLMSLKVTDYSARAPFVAKAGEYRSHMIRFQYERPRDLILGLPGQAGEFNRNGYRFELYNTDNFCHIPSRAPLYQSWPVLFHRAIHGDGWVSVFHDNPSRTFVDLGDFYDNQVTFESTHGNSRVYLLTGGSLTEASRKLTRLVGGSHLPPQWSFGYQQCRFSYMSSDEIRSVANSLRDHSIPCDAIYFDIDYMDGFRVFTADPMRFGDLKECVKDLKRDGIRAVPIMDPGVKVDEGYRVYKELKESKLYLTEGADSPFEIICWPGKAILPDFGDEPARQYWAETQARWIKEHDWDGIWNDMNEPSNFDGGNTRVAAAMTKRGRVADEYNQYGFHMANASAAGWNLAQPGKRGLIITRSGYPGVQQHSVIWHGDNHAWWEHLSLAVDTCIQYALAGAYYTGPDVPGFTGNPPDDLALRFFQIGAWLPLFRGHSIYFAKDKEPHAFSEAVRKHIIEAIRGRYSLLREWYSGFQKAIKEQTSPLMPCFDDSDSLIRHQFILFDKFLVAPIVERDQKQRAVYLPMGDWYELGLPTELISGNKWMLIPTQLNRIPVYVRAGSIVVRNTVGKNVEETLAAEEKYEIYPAADGSAMGYWYADNGISTVDENSKSIELSVEKGTTTVVKRTLR